MNNQQASQHQTLVPLRQFVKSQSYWQNLAWQSQERKDSVIEVAILFYCLANILDVSHHQNLAVRPTEGSLDNFLVRLHVPETPGSGFTSQWKHIKGVDMIVPSVSLDVIEPAALSDHLFSDSDSDGSTGGRYLEVKFTSLPAQIGPRADGLSDQPNDNEDSFCHLLGTLMYEIIYGEKPSPANNDRAKSKNVRSAEEPMRKKSSIQCNSTERLDSPEQNSIQDGFVDQSSTAESAKVGSPSTDLHCFGLPSSITLLVESLLGCDHDKSNPEATYNSLDAVCRDLLRSFIYPHTFLFPPRFSESSEANENIWFRTREIRLYGRGKEKSKVKDALLRVSSGLSEALFIEGASGVGKTKLVQSFLDEIRGYCFVVMEKFDQMDEGGPFSSVLSAFNSLCCEIAERSSRETLLRIANDLRNEFHSDFSFIANLLPSIYQICPLLAGEATDGQPSGHMNLYSISFLLQRFMKVVSSKGHPVLLFLDDLQWADESSLGLIQSVLFDLKKTSCFLFVGSYRSEEVTPEHAIFSMLRKLDTCGIHTTRISLGGLNETDLNDMVSDVLRVLPQLCWALTDLILYSTGGNPFFALMFLESLIQKNSVYYNIIEQRWVWDASVICNETSSRDIVSLITSKIGGLCEETQLALKTMACFGTKMHETVAWSLSLTPKHSNLSNQLNEAVGGGFIERHDSHYRFIHDNVQTSVYNLISGESREELHFELGVLLQSLIERQDSDILLYFVADQLMKAPLLLQRKHNLSFSVPELFVSAGTKAAKKSDFPRALTYFRSARSLLSHNHWSINYELCCRLFLFIAKSSYACGKIDEASATVNQILANGQCLEDKLEACHLSAIMDIGGKRRNSAYKTCIEVISHLHKPLPDLSDPKEMAALMTKTTKKVKRISLEILKTNEADERIRVTLKFYGLLGAIAFMDRKRAMFHYCFCTMIHLSLTNGVSDYAPIAFVSFAVMLCSSSLVEDIPLACKIGNLALAFQKDYDLTEQMPYLISSYYGFVAQYAVPLQACADKHRRGFEIGLSTGQINVGFMNAIFGVRAAFLSGANLHTLLKEISDYLSRANALGQINVKDHLEMYRDTILILIDNKSRSNSTAENEAPQGIQNFHLAIRSFWLGHHERCEHASNRLKDNPHPVNKSFLVFVQGLNGFLLKRGKERKVKKQRGESFIEQMRNLKDLCPFNFENKFLMLEAEYLSLEQLNPEAEASFVAAIAASKQFVHEEGLACELAGSHCLRTGKMEKALSYFTQSKECYEKWGSNTKVTEISNKIEMLTKKNNKAQPQV